VQWRAHGFSVKYTRSTRVNQVVLPARLLSIPFCPAALLFLLFTLLPISYRPAGSLGITWPAAFAQGEIGRSSLQLLLRLLF
jgi:hypothetical protein